MAPPPLPRLLSAGASGGRRHRHPSASRPGRTSGSIISREEAEATPAMTTAITSIRTSPLRMCVSSWPSTASIFGVVEAVEEAARHRDRILLLVEAAGEGVERVLLDRLPSASAW